MIAAVADKAFPRVPEDEFIQAMHPSPAWHRPRQHSRGVRRHKATFWLVALAAILSLSRGALALDFPTHRVRFVLPFPPSGSSTDVGHRIAAEELSAMWKQPVILENRPGGSQIIGFDSVAKASPDGHSLVITSSLLSVWHLLVKDLPFDPVKDFTTIAVTMEPQSAFCTNSQTPSNTLAEFVAYTKSRPGKVNYGSSGRTIAMLNVELFKQLSGADLTEIPYKGPAEQIVALLNNDISFIYSSPSAMKDYAAQGRAKCLFVLRDRLHDYPNIPSAAEFGLSSFSVRQYNGIAVRSDTPREIQLKLNEDLRSVFSKPAIARRIAALGAIPLTPPIDEVTRLVDDNATTYTRVIRNLHLRPE